MQNSHKVGLYAISVDLVEREKLAVFSLLAYLRLFARSSLLVMVPSGNINSHNGQRFFDLVIASDVELSSLLELRVIFSPPARAFRPNWVSAKVRLARSAAQDRFRKMNWKNCSSSAFLGPSILPCPSR